MTLKQPGDELHDLDGVMAEHLYARTMEAEVAVVLIMPLLVHIPDLKIMASNRTAVATITTMGTMAMGVTPILQLRHQAGNHLFQE